MQTAVEQTGSATALYSDSALRLHGKGERKSMWLFPVSFLSLTGSCFTCCIWSLPHVCIGEYLSLCVFLSNEFLPFNKIAFDWTWPDGAEVVLLIGPDVSNEAEVLELTSSLYSQLMCKIDPWFVLFLCHSDNSTHWSSLPPTGFEIECNIIKSLRWFIKITLPYSTPL